MRLVPNAKGIALKSHSMWAFYLSMIVLWTPDALFALLGFDTNPHIWMILSTVLIAYGIGWRLKPQGIDHA